MRARQAFLPLHPTDKRRNLGMPGSRTASDSTPLVLVVEHDRHTREMYSQFLSYSGFRVVEAHRVEDAWEKARTLKPAVITTGIGFDSADDGCVLVARLKNDERTSEIPVVVVTAWVLGGHIERAKRAGCDAVLLKPCAPTTLVSEIRRLLRF
jgi:CheY-like chemotaxis protein